MAAALCTWRQPRKLREDRVMFVGMQRCCTVNGPPHNPRTPHTHPSVPQLAEEEEFEAKRKELEEQASPVFAKLYQQGGGGMPGGGMPGADMPGGGAPTGPTVEEVD